MMLTHVDGPEESLSLLENRYPYSRETHVNIKLSLF